MDGRAADADVDRIDGGSGDFACIGFSGIYIGNNWKCDGADWISGGIGSAYDCENVLSSAATGLLLDIYKEFGTDSRNGMIASISMACTETIFYTMSVYFMSAKVKKTRYTLAGALIATFAGLVASVWLAALV